MTTKNHDKQPKLSPLHIAPDPAIGLEERQLWCPNDARSLPPVHGLFLCPCGLVVTITQEDLDWLKEEE